MIRYGAHSVNDTSGYHKEGIDTLGWELTVCNSLEPAESPCRAVLHDPRSYGELLYDFLAGRFGFGKARKVLEVGGGYGFLMRDFLRCNNRIQAFMLDISPLLLNTQRKTLAHENRVVFREGDFLEFPDALLAGFDAAILNENLGDFPTVCGIGKDAFRREDSALDPFMAKVREFIERYGLLLPEQDPCNVNLGALEAVEKLCAAGIPLIYSGEHSCESATPGWFPPDLRRKPAGNPERIALRGHDEYTIKFSHLVRIGERHGYVVARGPFSDFLPLEVTDRVRFILASGSQKDEHEIIRQFVDDLFLYEYVVMKKEG